MEDCVLHNDLICDMSMTLSDDLNSCILNAPQISHFSICPNFKAPLIAYG